MATLSVKTFRVLNDGGDSITSWDVNDVDTVTKARDQFGKMLEQAYVAVAVTENGEKEVIREFDPNAQEIVMFPAISGG